MSKDKNAGKGIDLNNYRDSSGVSLRSMDFGLWFAENRKKFIKMTIIFLIVLSAFFFIYSSYNYIIYFISGDPNAQITDANSPISPRKITSDLEISPLQSFSSGGHYDLAAKLKNPNDKFMASFQYCFSQNGKNLACGENFILPKEEKYVLSLAQDLSDGSGGLSFQISNVFWRRIDAHKIPEWSAFLTNHLDFPVTGLNFYSAAQSGLSDKVNLNTVEFSINNKTPYSYYEVPLDILLFNGSDLVGVQKSIMENYLTGETRAIKLSWAGDLPSVTRTEVKPDINILDDNVYLKYQGGN